MNLFPTSTRHRIFLFTMTEDDGAPGKVALTSAVTHTTNSVGLSLSLTRYPQAAVATFPIRAVASKRRRRRRRMPVVGKGERRRRRRKGRTETRVAKQAFSLKLSAPGFFVSLDGETLVFPTDPPRCRRRMRCRLWRQFTSPPE